MISVTRLYRPLAKMAATQADVLSVLSHVWKFITDVAKELSSREAEGEGWLHTTLFALVFLSFFQETNVSTQGADIHDCAFQLQFENMSRWMPNSWPEEHFVFKLTFQESVHLLFWGLNSICLYTNTIWKYMLWKCETSQIYNLPITIILTSATHKPKTTINGLPVHFPFRKKWVIIISIFLLQSAVPY